MNITAMIFKIVSPVVDFIQKLFVFSFGFVFFLLALFFVLFYVIYRINPFHPSMDRLKLLRIKFMPYDLFRWLLVDFLTRKKRAAFFREYGFTIFCGRQGSGKSMSMVEYLNYMHKKYPNCLIITNFKYAYSDKLMKNWRDLLTIRNGNDGVIFAIDEIQNEYNSDSWKDFPESLLSEICMQRKQKIKIVATSQVYNRVVKQIREQSFSVIMCNTYFNRLTRITEYDASEYGTSDTPYMVKKRCKPLRRHLFVQSDGLRECYDTDEKIERMEKVKFINRAER